MQGRDSGTGARAEPVVEGPTFTAGHMLPPLLSPVATVRMFIDVIPQSIAKEELREKQMVAQGLHN